MGNRGLLLMTFGAAGLALTELSFGAAAGAESLPRPAVDYRASAKAPGGVELEVAHRAGRLRLDVTGENLPGTMTSFIDLGGSRMTMLMAVPGMERTALDMELPADFAFAETSRESTRAGTDTVAGESCDVWQSPSKVADAPVDSCITADGIVLKTTTTIEGRAVVVYEVVALERAPQDPEQFQLPKGVKVTRVPSGLGGLVPGFGR